MSPHHGAYRRWVEPEYVTFPEVDSDERRALSALAIARDQRRDDEAATADWVITGSSFTTRSLIEAGVSPAKILTVPLAGPPAVDSSRLPAKAPAVTRFVYVGPVSVRKGAHYLLSSWKKVARPGMELHFYGKMLLPEHVWRAAQSGPGGDSIVFHGSIPSRELSRVYLDGSVLVLPTLCDGYGLVVSEALSHGLPVITTTNAGAADAVDNGGTGFVIPPADEEALTAAMRWCTENPRSLFAMRGPALEAARSRTWKEFRRLFAREIQRTRPAKASITPPVNATNRPH